MSRFRPHLEILSEPQRNIWPELKFTLNRFVLYGGTALALRLSHRVSEDFDFFSFGPLDTADLLRAEPLLAKAEVLQLETNTLSVLASSAGAPVKLSFFSGLTFGRIWRSNSAWLKRSGP